MKRTDLFFRRLPTLLLAGLFLVMATDVLHGVCGEGEGVPEKTEQVVHCMCICHHPVCVPAVQPVSARLVLARESPDFDANDPVPEAEPTGIFRPPKHLV